MGNGALADWVARQIIDLIANGKLEMGARLPSLDELTEMLGVSRTSVREAIKLLDAWGVVDVRHGVGTFIVQPTGRALTVPFRLAAELSERTIQNLLQLRQVLEPEVAAIAAQNIQPEQIAEMEDALFRMERSRTRSDEYSKADLDFHIALGKATGNELFLLLIYPTIDLFQDLIKVAHLVEGGADLGLVFHRNILEQVKARDAEKAREAMRAHIRGVEQSLRSVLDARDSESSSVIDG